MNDLKFSVSMSVYKNDNPEHFKTALESIFNQTVKPDEIVLVVDGPVPEEINSVIKSFGNHDELKVVYLPENKGLGNALSVSLENCSYEFIARMDADDIAAQNRFEQQIKFLIENKNLDMVGGDVTEFIGSPDNIVSKRIVPKTHEEICEYMKKRCPFNHMTVMFKKSAVLSAGGYLDWHFNEDYYLWIRMLLNNCKFANTGTVLVNMRVSDEMYSRRGGIKYFKSEAGLQKLMLDKKVISYRRYLINVFERLVLQVLMPNKLRAFVFKKFARRYKNV